MNGKNGSQSDIKLEQSKQIECGECGEYIFDDEDIRNNMTV